MFKRTWAPRPIEKMESKPIKVLLVENNTGDARVVREVIQEISTGEFDVTLAEHLDEALARLGRGERFDVALTDLSLPDGTGLGGFRRLRATAPTLPVIVLSGVDDDDLG